MNAFGTLHSPLLSPTYQLSRANNEHEVELAQVLRYEVFNRELQEGLPSSDILQRDVDAFDLVCDHLIVKDISNNQVVGTYRMQTGSVALENLGYYCAQEFDLSVFDGLESETIELGRACIAKEHRNFQVLSLLWRGIAEYAQNHGARYLLGCSSLTSQIPDEGLAAYRAMQRHLAPIEFRTYPHLSHLCSSRENTLPEIRLPKLLSAYLSLGAWICGPPALDREFRTIDFLTLMDLKSEDMTLRRQRFGITNGTGPR